MVFGNKSPVSDVREWAYARKCMYKKLNYKIILIPHPTGYGSKYSIHAKIIQVKFFESNSVHLSIEYSVNYRVGVRIVTLVKIDGELHCSSTGCC